MYSQGPAYTAAGNSTEDPAIWLRPAWAPRFTPSSAASAPALALVPAAPTPLSLSLPFPSYCALRGGRAGRGTAHRMASLPHDNVGPHGDNGQILRGSQLCNAILHLTQMSPAASATWTSVRHRFCWHAPYLDIPPDAPRGEERPPSTCSQNPDPTFFSPAPILNVNHRQEDRDDAVAVDLAPLHTSHRGATDHSHSTPAEAWLPRASTRWLA